ncbi:SDR family NAD(P)-dependent oxidoreductase [Rhodobium gokarnense]|uniref:3-oxoacyl-[acyl-carrier protein] reductase n=1 Tax=Rhodobium gokarnense TaxID=364296 RepID=A0ABT3HAY9_9HYPH|nr:SDR family NAD(P)-dependent oxidoreductase [Rhodobium gokarnense]MCW2307563.1 3-oxoacyl-[acyl-carrier protein] reductase [Rhodobium gokarnense]
MIPRRGDNQTVLITGCSRGIGRAIAERFAAEGYHVIANDLDRQAGDLASLKAAIEAAGGRCDTLFADVSDPASVEALVSNALKLSPRIDVLVNNAGVLSVFNVEDIAPDEWDRIFDVNAKGTFLVTKALLAHFRANGKGRIVNIASVGGKRGAPGQAHYCASKAAVIRFSQILAQEVAPDGITVNSVCPGIIDTDMGRNNYPDEASLQAVKDKTALGRLGYPEDVVGAAAFFASDDAAFITGQALNVCGGILFD